MTKHRPPVDDEVTIVYERDRPVAVTMPYAAYERLRGVDPFADRPLSRDPVDLDIARAGDKANAAEAAVRRRVAAREGRAVTETVPAAVARALAAGVTPLKAWREGRGLTQAVLAARAGLSRAYLAQLEAGTREPSLSALPLKAWREGRGLTQAVLAARAGLSRAYLAQLEAGTREPSLSALRRLAAALDLLADDLIPTVGRG